MAWNPAFLALFRAFGARTIVTEHDGLPLPGEAWPLEGFARTLCLWLAARRIFLSERVRDRHQQGDRDTSFVVPLGVLGHGGLRESAREPPGRALRVLFLGRVTPRKGVDLLLDALPHLPVEVVATLTIAGEPEDRRDLRTTDARVRWLSRWLSDEEIAELVRSHDALVLPYRHASQSGVVTIGIAGAIPMICTRAGGLEEQLAADEALFVDSTPRAIAEALRRLAVDFKTYRRMSRLLVDKRSRSSWSEIAGRIEKIITRADCGRADCERADRGRADDERAEERWVVAGSE
ncbi:MAG: glycosyltransferase family 4 protein [Acidobacteriota bacterium]